MRNKTEVRPKKSPPSLSPSQPSGLIAKKPRRSAGPKPVLDDHSHRTTLALCCTRNMLTRSASRQASAPTPQLTVQNQRLVSLPRATHDAARLPRRKPQPPW